MKKGKTSRIQGFKTVKVLYGTVDSINLKSVYLNVQTWVQPIKDSENWNRIVLNFGRAIKHVIHDTLNKSLFDDNFIVDVDLRSSGITVGKKSFLNLEINFFLKDQTTDFKSNKLREELKSVVKNIIQHNFQKNDYFKFHLSKTVKQKEKSIKTETV
jgi:hypothetical protein